MILRAHASSYAAAVDLVEGAFAPLNSRAGFTAAEWVLSFDGEKVRWRPREEDEDEISTALLRDVVHSPAMASEEEIASLEKYFSVEKHWVQEAWAAAFSSCGLTVPKALFEGELDAPFDAFADSLKGTLQKLLAGIPIPADDASLEAEKVFAFHRLSSVFLPFWERAYYGESPDAKLPFLPGMELESWPAHLLGDAEQAPRAFWFAATLEG